MARRSAIETALRDVLKEEGVEDFTVEKPKRGHPRVVLSINGRTFKYVFPTTTSCYRAQLNCVTGLRRAIRGLRDAADRRTTASQQACSAHD